MKWLEAAFAHMVAIRNLGQAYQIRNCMGQQGWSLDVGAFHRYTEKWIGREAVGTAPQAAFLNGKVDPWQMLFTKPMGHNKGSRESMLPDRKTCAPYKDPACWKRKSLLLMETCEYCCSPFQHKGGRGADICWDSEWTYERCCQQDFKDLICELNRKGEEGGCVDCKKSVTYICLTPTEKRLKDAQNNYNKNVDAFNEFQNKSAELAQDIRKAREDLLQKDQVYRDLHEDLNRKLSIWHVAYNNASRLSSLGRLRQQELTWNNSHTFLNEERLALQAAQSTVANLSKVLFDARRDEEAARQSVRNNFSQYERAVNHFEATSNSLTSAKAAMAAAEEESRQAEVAQEAAAVDAKQAFAASVEANASRDAQHSSTEAALELARAVRDQSRTSAVEYLGEQQIADAHLDAVRTQGFRFCGRVPSAVNAVSKPREDEAAEKLRAAEQSWQLAGQAHADALEALSDAQRDEDVVVDSILSCGGGGSNSARAASPLSCLIAKTPSNQSKPELRPLPQCLDGEGKGTCNLQTGCPKVKGPATCDSSKDGSGTPDCLNDTHGSASLESTVSEVTQRLWKAGHLSQEALSEARARSGVQPEETVYVYVPSELTSNVEAKGKIKAELAAQYEAASKVVGMASLALEKAKADLQKEVKRQEAMDTDLQEARRHSSQLAVEIVMWEEYSRTNRSVFDERQQVLKRLRRTAESLNRASQEAFNRSDDLLSQYLLARNESETKMLAQEEAQRGLIDAEHNVQRVNETLSDNLTVLVSAWLQQQETAKASQSGRWSERLLAAAKEVLVTMVGSLESFLDNYVISLSDKDSVLQLMHAVDARKEAELRWLEAEKDLEKAVEEVQAVNASLADAKAAHRAAQQKSSNATKEASQAEDDAAAAERSVNQTRQYLLSQQQQLEKVRKKISDIEEKKQTFAHDLATAEGQVERQASALRRAEEQAKEVDTELAKATSAEKAAEAAVSNAKTAFVGSTLADARKECQPTDNQYEVYLHFRELLSLAKYVKVQRLLGLQVADQFRIKKEEVLRDVQVANAALLDDLGDALSAVADLAIRVAVVDSENATVQVRQQVASFSASKAKENFFASQGHMDEILQGRQEAELWAVHQAKENFASLSRLDLAEKNMRQRRLELAGAKNRTEQLERDLLAAIQAEAEANASLRSSQVWQKEFNASLQLERKEEALASAKLEESRKSANEVKAAKREKQMRASLDTHKRHLALLDAQVDLQNKTKSKVEARAAFDAAEKQVVEAQTKLDGLVKTEAETHTKISETYEEINRLKIEHTEAEQEYQEQDPEDRKRSFTTSLQGGGA